MTSQKIANLSSFIFVGLVFLGVILSNAIGEDNPLYKLDTLLIAISGLWVIGYGIRYFFLTFQSKVFGGSFYAFTVFWLILTGFFGWVILTRIF